MWAWVVGGIAGLILLCCCGIALLGGVGEVFSRSTSSSTSEETPDPPPTSAETTDQTPTSTTTDAPTTPSTSTTSVPTTSTTTTTRTTSVPTPTQSVPPTPAGSTANTDTSQRLTSDQLEGEIAKGFSVLKKSDITCTTGITLIAGRATTCSAPNPLDSSEDADIEVEVAWAQIRETATTRRIEWYLTFQIEAR